jgi:hypothetical protein
MPRQIKAARAHNAFRDMRFPCFFPSGGHGGEIAASGDISGLLATIADPTRMKTHASYPGYRHRHDRQFRFFPYSRNNRLPHRDWRATLSVFSNAYEVWEVSWRVRVFSE